MVADPHLRLSPAARERIRVGYRMIDATDAEAQPLKKQLQRFGAASPRVGPWPTPSTASAG
jgi:hypothetical protein